jgi:hypothetical protein
MSRKKTDIYIMGDVHRDFAAVSQWVRDRQPKVVLQCGDFGYWPNTPDMTEPDPGTRPAPVPDVGTTQLFFCDGNHEDHDALASLEHLGVYPNVYYMQRGMTLRLPDGRVVLFVGGARSIDASMRTPGRDWFEQEELRPEDVGFLEDIHVDIVVSHTCPLEFQIQDEREHGIDPSRIVLSLILERFRPDHWFFGHYHLYKTGRAKGCWWTALPKVGEENWCVPLPPPRRRKKKW